MQTHLFPETSAFYLPNTIPSPNYLLNMPYIAITVLVMCGYSCEQKQIWSLPSWHLHTSGEYQKFVSKPTHEVIADNFFEVNKAGQKKKKNGNEEMSYLRRDGDRKSFQWVTLKLKPE